MKTQMIATLFAIAAVASFGIPAAAADDASVGEYFIASGSAAPTYQFQLLASVTAVPLSPKAMDVVRARLVRRGWAYAGYTADSGTVQADIIINEISK